MHGHWSYARNGTMSVFFLTLHPLIFVGLTNDGLFGYNTGFSTSFTRISSVLVYFGGSKYTVPGARLSELLLYTFYVSIC